MSDDVPVEAAHAALEKHGPAGAALYVDAWARGGELPDDERMGAVAEVWSEDEWIEGLAAAESERTGWSEASLSNCHEPRLTAEQYAQVERIERAEAGRYRSPTNELLFARLRAGDVSPLAATWQAEKRRLEAESRADDVADLLGSYATSGQRSKISAGVADFADSRPWSQFDPPRHSGLAAKERAFEAKVAARAAVERRTGAPDDDPRVTRNPIRRGVLRVIEDLARVRVAFPSVRWLAGRLMCSARTVRRHLEDLNAWGYVSRHARFWRSGVQRSCLWVPRRPETQPHPGHVGSAKSRVDWLAKRETLPRWLRLDTRSTKPSLRTPKNIARTGCALGSSRITLGVTPHRACSVTHKPHLSDSVAPKQRGSERAHRHTLSAQPDSCAPS